MVVLVDMFYVHLVAVDAACVARVGDRVGRRLAEPGLLVWLEDEVADGGGCVVGEAGGGGECCHWGMGGENECGSESGVRAE